MRLGQDLVHKRPQLGGPQSALPARASPGGRPELSYPHPLRTQVPVQRPHELLRRRRAPSRGPRPGHRRGWGATPPTHPPPPDPFRQNFEKNATQHATQNVTVWAVLAGYMRWLVASCSCTTRCGPHGVAHSAAPAWFTASKTPRKCEVTEAQI